MRKISKKIKYLLIGVAFSLLFSSNVFAEGKHQINENDNDQYTFTSDGKDGTETSKTSDQTTNSTTTPTKEYTVQEKNSISTQQDIRKTLTDWKTRVQNTPNYTQGKFSDGDDQAVNFSYIKIKKYEMAGLLNSVTTYKNTFSNGTDNINVKNTGNKWVDNSELPSTDLGHNANSSDYKDMTDEEKQMIKTGIILNERGDKDNSKKHIKENINNTLKKDGSSTSKFTVSGVPVTFTWKDQTYNKPTINPPTSNTTHPRIDLFNGDPAFTIPSNYQDRFKPSKTQAENEKWPYSRNQNNQKVFDTNSKKYKSAVLKDDIYIGLFTEYHIETVKKNQLTNIDYTSDERRWTIYKDGKKVSEPVITDNPRHELNFTEVYKKYGAGEYYVEAEQLATFTRSTYASYDKCEYLYDMGTGMILWFNEYLVTANNGFGLYIGSEYVDVPEWVSTGDTFTVTVNDQGGIDKNESDSTKRVD